MDTEKQDKFDLNIVYDKFTGALIEDDDVLLALYLESYNELDK